MTTHAANVTAQIAQLPTLLRIPRQAGHPFQSKLDTDSRRSWTVIPRQAGHPFQSKLDSQK